MTHRCVQIPEPDPQLTRDGPYGEVRRGVVDIDDLRGIVPSLVPPEYPQPGYVEVAAKVLRYDPENETQWNGWMMVSPH